MLQDYLLAKLIDDSTVGTKIRSDSNVSEKGKYALDATEKNPDIEDTLAEQIADLANTTSVLKQSVTNIIALPNGASTGDGQIEDAKVGIEGEVYDTLGESIREQIKTYRDVDVSNNVPDNKAKVWVNTSLNEDETEDICIPEVRDGIISSEDTWSSNKIDNKISAMGNKISLLGLTDKKYSNKVDQYKWSPVNVQVVNGKVLSNENNLFISKVTIRVKTEGIHQSNVNVLFYHRENNTLTITMSKSFTVDIAEDGESELTFLIEEILEKGDIIGVSSPDSTIEVCTTDTSKNDSVLTISDGTNIAINSIHAIATDEEDFGVSMVVNYSEYERPFDSGLDKAYEDKNIVVFGDIRTWYDGQEYQENTNIDSGVTCVGYQHWMKSYLGGYIISRGFKDLTSVSISSKIKTYDFENTDVLVIGNIINDWYKGEAIGTLKAIGSTFDTTTIYGAVQSAIEHVIKSKPTIKIYIVNPAMAWKDISSNNEQTLSDNYKVIYKNIAELYNLPFLDLSDKCQFNKLTRDTYFADQIDITDSYISLNDLGNEVIGRLISVFLINN